jgi:hypothetical protein
MDDCLYNIIHDTVLSVYSSEKKLRMQSAAIQVEAIALQGPGGPGTPAGGNTKSQLQGQYSTAAAMWDNGKITLRGNPLKLLKENWCINCKLPRLMFPLTGIGARIPDDTSRQFCTLHPFINKPGHDIYGNPFPVDPGKTKKEREALRKLERQEKDNTPGSAEAGQDGDGASASGVGLSSDPNLRKLMAGGKGASYVPWHTCPSCKRSLLITKFAQHLEKCMGIGGRSARNAAAARLGVGNGSSAAGSNAGSRTGTPTPSVAQANGKREADDDEDDGPPKKKVRKERKDKKEKKEKMTIKFKSKADAGKASAGEQRLVELDAGGKQDHDMDGQVDDDEDDEEEVAPKKKMKLSAQGSPAASAG